jgi:hypothetical protein
MGDSENLYDKPEDKTPATSEKEEESPKEQAGNPALINLEVWPDAKPGEVKTFRCLKVMEKEIEVVAEDDEQGEPSEEKPPSTASEPQESMMD